MRTLDQKSPQAGLISDQGVTVKMALLVALPPGVVRTTFPVLAPVGTMKVTCLSEDTGKTPIFTPPRVIVAAWSRPAPASVTASPTLPLGGVTLVMWGVTLNICLDSRVPDGVVKLTIPVSPEGTLVVR